MNTSFLTAARAARLQMSIVVLEMATEFATTQEELAGMLESMEDVMARASILGEEEEEMLEAEK